MRHTGPCVHSRSAAGQAQPIVFGQSPETNAGLICQHFDTPPLTEPPQPVPESKPGAFRSDCCSQRAVELQPQRRGFLALANKHTSHPECALVCARHTVLAALLPWEAASEPGAHTRLS